MNGKYDLNQVAKELDETALGQAHHGNALRVAKDWPGATADDRALLDRYATGRNAAMDHIALQDLAVRLREPAGVGGEWVLVPREPTETMLSAANRAPDERALYQRMLSSAPQPPAEAQAQGGGEVPEAELIALVAGPFKYHHKMDEAAEREGKAFDRCRELTIQNIRTWCATRRAMLAAAPPSALVGVEDVVMAARNAENAIRNCAAAGQIGEGYVQYADDLRDAVQRLAKQPAAVDGAMVERLALALAMYEQHRTTMQSLASSVGDFLRDYRALAAQPGGAE